MSTGKMLGGSGSHNANIYFRGSPRDYENYATLTGDRSWSYENMLRHFKTTESFRGWLVSEDERAGKVKPRKGTFPNVTLGLSTGLYQKIMPKIRIHEELNFRLNCPFERKYW